MLVSVGYLIIIISVFGGFALAGGHLASLWQPVAIAHDWRWRSGGFCRR